MISQILSKSEKEIILSLIKLCVLHVYYLACLNLFPKVLKNKIVGILVEY